MAFTCKVAKIMHKGQSYNNFLLSNSINRNLEILFCQNSESTYSPTHYPFCMKPSKRMNTNQTNISNKKSPQISHDVPSFQLPKIQKTSNYDSTSNVSYDLDLNDDKSHRYQLDQIEQNEKEEFGLVNYDKMTMEEIKHEYQRLRDEVTTLNSELKKKSEMIQSKIMKKQTNRNSNPIETQKKLVLTEHEVYENSLVLTRLRQEYEQLEKRSNLANSSISRPNAEMNEKILSLREKIMTIKEKIKVLRRKTKKTGNDIVDGQNYHEIFQKLDRELKSYEAKQANLEAKIDGSKYKIERQDEMLNEIEKAYGDAQDYLRLFKLQNEQITEKNSLVQEYKQRIHKQEVLRKKIESDQQTYLQKYHQMLKVFELESEKQQKIDKKMIDGDIKILKASNTILDLERQLEELEDISQRMNEQLNLKKQAELLRNAMQRNDAFMTENGFSMTSHMIGVSSIKEENESEVRETIENIEANNESATIQPASSANSNVRVKTNEKKTKIMFTKVDSGSKSKKESHTNTPNVTATVKVISEENPVMNEAKYYLSSKEISKKREEQKNLTTLRKQSSTNDNKNGRKVYSLIKPNEASKLKELSINRTTNKEIRELKIPSIRDDRKDKDMLPHTAKIPYIALARNTHEEKGKQSLRERKSSLKIVGKVQGDLTKEVKKSLLDELEQVSRQLEDNIIESSNLQSQNNTIEMEGKDEMLETLQKTKPLFNKQKQKEKESSSKIIRVSQEIPNRAELTGKIVKPSSKQGRVVKPDSKEGKIRHQPAIKPEVLSEIDKRNLEYSIKIEEMKQQLLNKEGAAYESGSKSVIDTKATTLEPKEQVPLIVAQPKQEPKQVEVLKPQKLSQKQIPLPPKQSQIGQVSLVTHQKKSAADESDSDLSDDGDIEDDLSEINKMIKHKLSLQKIQQVKAE